VMDDVVCIEEVELITEYLEGALPAAQARRLERHLEECEGCTEYVAQMRTVAGSLRALGGESISADTRDALLAAFRRNA
jgi:anti-sigma factor RsiW